MAPLVGEGAPQTVHSRCRVRLESDIMFCPVYMMVDYICWQLPNNRTFHLEILDSSNMHHQLAVRHRVMVNCISVYF